MKPINEEFASAKIDRDQVKHLLSDWHRRARQSQRVQYDSGKQKNRLHYIFGVPTIILTSIVGTTIFASLAQESSVWIKITTGCISIISASLASLQTFLGYNEKSEKYKQHSAKYGAVRRDIEFLMAFLPEDKNELLKSIAAIKLRMDELAESSQNISEETKRKAVASLNKQTRKNELFKIYDNVNNQDKLQTKND